MRRSLPPSRRSSKSRTSERGWVQKGRRLKDGGTKAIHQVPSDDIPESVEKMRIRGSDQLRTVLAFSNKTLNNIIQNRAARN